MLRVIHLTPEDKVRIESYNREIESWKGQISSLNQQISSNQLRLDVELSQIRIIHSISPNESVSLTSNGEDLVISS